MWRRDMDTERDSSWSDAVASAVMTDYEGTRALAKFFGVMVALLALFSLAVGNPTPVLGGLIAAPVGTGFMAFLEWLG